MINIKKWSQFNESLNTDLDFKKGDIAFCKNQYMDQAERYEVSDVTYSSNGEILKIELIKGRDITNLSHTEQGVAVSTIVDKIGSEIDNIIDNQPNQISDLFDFIEMKHDSQEVRISFTEEIKDGRASKFNRNDPYKLRNKIISAYDVNFRIDSIKYLDSTSQPSEYNEYVDYNYIMKITKI